jgi:hypothetical protein
MLGRCVTPSKATPPISLNVPCMALIYQDFQYRFAVCGRNSHDHEAQLIALYVESDSEKGFLFDRPLPDLRLQEGCKTGLMALLTPWLGFFALSNFGKPGLKIS